MKVDKRQGGTESAQVDKKIPTVNIIYLKTLRESQKGAPRTSHRLSSCFLLKYVTVASVTTAPATTVTITTVTI